MLLPGIRGFLEMCFRPTRSVHICSADLGRVSIGPNDFDRQVFSYNSDPPPSDPNNFWIPEGDGHVTSLESFRNLVFHIYMVIGGNIKAVEGKFSTT